VAPLGVAHADCTAQAVRIWSCVDATRYRGSIERARDYLTTLTVDGGVRYRAGSNDINTWATIFAAQAADFVHAGGEWRWII
jgi:hypothetical protein